MGVNIYLEEMQKVAIGDIGVTHNLVPMAEAAGLYKVMWRPEEINVTKAFEALPLLQAGLSELREHQDSLQELNPKNGWGSYWSLLDAVIKLIVLCENHPNADYSAER